MELEEFCDKVVKRLREECADKSIHVNTVSKNNGLELHSVCISDEKRQVMPMLYLESYYHENMEEESIAEVVRGILEKNEETQISDELFDIKGIQDFEKVKDKIYYELINSERNQKRLLDIPHRKFLDLEVVYRICVAIEEQDDYGSILSTNRFLESWECEE